MTDLELAQEIFAREAPMFVLVREGRELARGALPGVREFVATLQRLGADARGASLADKVVGKAVAIAAAHAGIIAIATPLASELTTQTCMAHGIALHAARIVPRIKNATGDGLCPMESLVLGIAEPLAAVAALRQKLNL